MRRGYTLFAKASKKAAVAAASTATAATPEAAPPAQDPFGMLHRWVLENDVRVEGLELKTKPHNHPGRGIYATTAHRQGTTLFSAPLGTCSFNADKLLASEFVAKSNPPRKSFMRSEMLNAGVLDQCLSDQLYLALLLATERMNPNSKLMPYFNALPIPAIDDDAVLLAHNDSLSEGEKMQWQAHREDFVHFLRSVSAKWECPESHKPPIQVLDWAWRTVLCRQSLLPDKGAPPAALTRIGFVSYYLMQGDRTLYQRLKAKFFPDDETLAEIDYDLVPTLVPFLDSIDHSPNSNVSLEVADRGDFGTCVELQAVSEIAAGEEICLTFSRSHTLPFTVYRFGFVPQ